MPSSESARALLSIVLRAAMHVEQSREGLWYLPISQVPLLHFQALPLTRCNVCRNGGHLDVVNFLQVLLDLQLCPLGGTAEEEVVVRQPGAGPPHQSEGHLRKVDQVRLLRHVCW